MLDPYGSSRDFGIMQGLDGLVHFLPDHMVASILSQKIQAMHSILVKVCMVFYLLLVSKQWRMLIR